jgi:cytochrome c oxidase subunit 2
MLGTGAIQTALQGGSTLAQLSRGNQVDVFSELYRVFLGLGTVVGVVVISYLLYNAYKYRTDAPDAEGKYDVAEEESDDEKVVRPELGELPTDAKGGKKLFLSFGISAFIVLGLVIYSYSLLLYVEDTKDADMEIDVEGFQFGWGYEYDNGFQTDDQLIVPANQTVELNVTSRDVMHNYGLRGLRAKADAIPGQNTRTWFQADAVSEPRAYQAICFELCGSGHSSMREKVYVIPEEEYEYSQNETEFAQWYEQKLEELENEEIEVSN